MIYLNNAASSFPKPESLVSSVTSCLTSLPVCPGRSTFDGCEDVIAECRKRVAVVLGGDDPNRIVFTSGATESMNLALRGLSLESAHVITTTTEHNSVLRLLKTMERDGLIELSIAGCNKNGAVSVEDIRAMFKQNTKLIVINHASNVTGEIQDVWTMAEIAHARGALILVDAAQSAGCIPIDAGKWQLDLLAFAGHKSLYGIQGIGGLYIRPGIDLAPLKVGGTGTRSAWLYQPDELPTKYEAGTPNVLGIVSLKASIEFINATEMSQIKAVTNRHMERLLDGLVRLEGVTLYGRRAAQDRLPVLSFNMNGLFPSDVGYILEQSFGIVVRSGLHCAPLIHQELGTYPEGAVRISPSYFTTDGEIDQFLDAMRQIGRDA